MKPDRLIWSNLSRRGFLFGSAAAMSSMPAFAARTPSCTLTSEQEEGPYYVDAAQFRGDITEGKPGVPVKLRVALVDSKRCTPLTNAVLDIWHCDASGIYSGFTASSPDGGGGFGGPGGPGGGRGSGGGPEQFRAGMPPPGLPPDGFGTGGRGGRGARKIDDTRFLRGMQISSKQGIVEFATLYPGWYSGRAIHIHMKVHLAGEQAAGTYAGGHVAHTGQLFFPEDITERIAKAQPYAKRLSIHRTTQEEDGIFASQHGAGSLVQLERMRNGSDLQGFVATVTLAIDPDATPSAVQGGPGGRDGRGRGGPPPFER